MMEFISFLYPSEVQLLQNLQTKNISVVEDAPICNSRKYSGYTYSSKGEKKKNELVICTSVLKQVNSESTLSVEINNTITHESVHIAQSCKNNGYIIPIQGKDIEKEAFSYEGYPDKVNVLINKYCK